MSDITNRSVVAAVIDQKVAGTFKDVRYAYTPVIDEKHRWAIGIAVENEPGYNPIEGLTFPTEPEARTFTDGMNEHLGLTRDDVIGIVISSMRRPVKSRLRIV